MAVIKDVAQYAGLSVSVVSKYLKNANSVRPDTRERIERAIGALGYQPSLAARALRTGRAGVVSVVIPDVTNPFFAELYDHIRQEAESRGYSVLLQSTGAAPARRGGRDFSVPAAQRVDGVILCFPDEDSSAVSLAAQVSPAPLVLLSWHRVKGVFDTISLDVCSGVAEMTRHLISLGHRDIGYVGWHEHSVISRQKHRGFQTAMEEAGLAVEKAWHFNGRFTHETGYRGAQSFFEQKKHPTAIVAENDILAVGCVKYGLQHGLRVPEDVAVTGFDDIPFAAMYDPPLTTMRAPLAEIAGTAVGRVLDGPAQQPGEGGAPLVFHASLVVRKTTDPGYHEFVYG